MKSVILTSINDILDADIFNPETGKYAIISMLIMGCIIIPLAIKFAKKSNNKIYGDINGNVFKLPNIKIIDKRTSPHPDFGKSVMVNYVVAESADGQRFEFAVKSASIFSTIVLGDIGDITYQGKTVIGFRRKIV